LVGKIVHAQGCLSYQLVLDLVPVNLDVEVKSCSDLMQVHEDVLSLLVFG
jgi:hypothetical protein